MVTLVRSDQELLNRAQQAGEAYRKLYGRYPAKIGIPRMRSSLLARTPYLFFLEKKEPAPITQVAELAEPTLAAELIQVPLEIVVGEDISPHEIYLPHPYEPDKAVSFPGLQKLLAERGDL